MNNSTETNAPGTIDTEKPVKKTRKINGFIVIGLILLVILVSTYRPAINTVHCDEDILASKPDIIMLGTWWCPYCYQARKYFQNHNIHYCEYDIEKSDVGKQRYDETKATTIPVLIIGNYLLQGFSETNIEEALILSKENNVPTK